MHQTVKRPSLFSMSNACAIVFTLSLILLPQSGRAELQQLFFSGQPGMMIDTNGNGAVDAGDGMVTAMYDADTDVIVFQLDESLGGGIAIYQIDTQFSTQVLQEIPQFPLDGPAQFENSRPASQFTTIFLDTVDFTPLNAAVNQLLQKLLGGSQ